MESILEFDCTQSSQIRYSVEGDKRVIVFARWDGFFSYIEECAIDSHQNTWKIVSGNRSIYADSNIAWSEAIESVEWLKREESWSAFYEPERTATINAFDFVSCPFCSVRFSLHDKNRWGGNRHLTCGQKIEIQVSEATLDL
jgi:hypothetical protein